MSALLNKSIAIGLLFAIAITALMFGTVEAWSVALFELIVVVLLLFWAIKAAADKSFKVFVPKTALPVAGLLLVGLMQSLALPGDGALRSLSMDVEATRGATLNLFFLFASMLIAANFFHSRDRLRLIASFLVAYGVAMAMFALIQHFTWSGKFYWFRPNTQSASPFGPFANHNHFAGYMEMLIPVPVALLAARAVRGERRLVYGFSAVLMGVALVVSLSRGGMIALAAGLLFIAFWSWNRSSREARLSYLESDAEEIASHRGEKRDGRLSSSHRLSRVLKTVGATAAISAAIIIGVIWIGADPIINRIAGAPEASNQETFFTSRGWIWSDTFSMIRANPITGVGLGAFETVYPIYSRSDGSLRVNYAHNDYLQILSDAGVIGGALAVWFVALMWQAFKRGSRSRDPLLRGLSLAGGASIFSMLVHSLFDFNLQIPSNALLFLVFSAIVSNIAIQIDLSERGSKREAADAHAARSSAIGLRA